MSDLVRNAIIFAEEAHRGQVRKHTNEPYINHPLHVLEIVRSLVPNASEEMLAAAVLHDVVEDTEVTIAHIWLHFGWSVALLVLDLTKPASNESRKVRSQQEVLRLSEISGDAQTIKYADIISNLSDIWLHDADFAPLYSYEKQQQISAMNKGYESLRQTAWLATIRRDR